MEVTSIITIMFLFASIVILFIMYIRKKTNCQPCSTQDNQDNKNKKSIRIKPELDFQFSEENLPSKVYEGIFTSPNPWIGGYSSGMNAGRTSFGKQPNSDDQ